MKPIPILLSLLTMVLSANLYSQSGKDLSDSLDVTHYEIHLKVLDFSGEEIFGNTSLDITSKVDNLNEIRLELLDLTVDSVFVDGSGVFNFSHSNEILSIPLTQVMNNGDSRMVRVVYHGVPFNEDWGGFHFSGQYAFNLGVGFISIPHNLGKAWFPCVDDFQDRAPYDYHITVEDSKSAVCGGLLQGVTDNGDGTHTFHWKTEKHIPTYLASVAIGEYVNMADIYSGMEADIPIEIWVRPSDTAKVAGSFQNLHPIMDILEQCYGPYPFDRIGYTGTAIGAMEHAENIAYPNFCIDNTLTYESLYTHELSHMWFGDAATCASAEDMWLNEGWATYTEALYAEYLYGIEEYKDFFWETNADVLQFCHTNGGDGSYFPLNQIPQEYTYGMSAYDKGACVAHSIRGHLGDDKFFTAVKAYLNAYHFDAASSHDMRDIFSSSTGVDMTGFFENWVFTSGTPHFSIDSFSVTSGKPYNVSVYMKQKHKGADYLGYDNIVEVTFMDNDWSMHSDTIHFSGATGMSIKQVPFEPDFVMFDYNEKLCDAISDFSHVIKEVDDYVFTNTMCNLEVQAIDDSAFVRIEHNWVAPDSMKNPLPGLTLSDYRYWKISGIFPDGFVAKGKFWYSQGAYLDNNLLTDPNDSLVMLYREGAADDWHNIPFEQFGPWSIGNIYVENLQPGEYTLAVWDDVFVGTTEAAEEKTNLLRVFPNPASQKININLPPEITGAIKIFDGRGRLVDSIPVISGINTCTWQPEKKEPGVYFLQLINSNNKILATDKVLFTK